MKTAVAARGLIVLLALAACRAEAPGPTDSPDIIPSASASATATARATLTPAPASSRTVSATPAATNTRPALTPGASVANLVELARADLARRLNRPESDIELVSVEPAELSQSNLGCPPPSTNDGPVIPGIVLGHVIWLEAEGQTYEYHAHGRRVVLCEP